MFFLEIGEVYKFVKWFYCYWYIVWKVVLVVVILIWNYTLIYFGLLIILNSISELLVEFIYYLKGLDFKINRFNYV